MSLRDGRRTDVRDIQQGASNRFTKSVSTRLRIEGFPKERSPCGPTFARASILGRRKW